MVILLHDAHPCTKCKLSSPTLTQNAHLLAGGQFELQYRSYSRAVHLCRLHGKFQHASL